ncbi:phage major capsid protein [Clostridium sp. YIM B02551]|uniref:phage major capsid protein n=1 Tax=Clostridium sp. YIM B02551 TaxID=2910679 RepID=UPI001EECD143|nr:phage major capsid protein [Clostridium sp. YIM B02551]
MSKELRELFEQLRNAQDRAKQIMNKADVKADEIKASTDEIQTLKAKIEAQKAIDDDKVFDANGIEITNQEIPPTNQNQESPRDKNALHVKAFAKAIAKKVLNAEEISVLSSNVDADGGYLIPKDIVTKINLLSREHVSLRSLVTVVSVTTKEGSRVIEKNASRNPFIDVQELKQLPDISSPNWDQVSYKIRDLGGLLPIPNSLIEDETGGLEDYLAQWFVQKAYATDNQMILFDNGSKGSQGIIGTAKSKADMQETDRVFEKEVLAEVLSFDKLKKVLNKDFPITISKVAKIVTNQSGLDILDSMVDKNGRPYLTGDGTEEFPYKFKGKQVVVYDDETIPNDNTDVANPLVPFIVGDLKQGLILWDRKQMSIASSKEAGFVNNSLIMRGIIRQDVRIWDNKAVKVIYSKM